MSRRHGGTGNEQMTNRDQEARRAYDAMAVVYDDFTDNHDFDLWLGNLVPALERAGVPSLRLLDVACGTGKSFLPMLRRGWSVTACDISPRMIAIAEEKVAPNAPVRLEVADMRELPLFGQFGLAWCLTDAINYLLTQEELEETIKAVSRNLQPNGLLAFDVNTLRAYRTFFAEETVVTKGQWKLIWQGCGSTVAGPGAISEATFTVEPIGATAGVESGPALPMIHRQRHFPQAQILAALESAELEAVETFGIHYDAVLQQPLDEVDHTKAVYIARRVG